MLKDKDINKIKKLYASGLSQIKIAKKYNVSVSVIYAFMKKHGIKARNLKDANSKRIAVSSHQEENIWSLYNDGYNRDSIASMLNMTSWSVRKTIQGKCRGKAESIKIYNKNNTVKLTHEQEQFILGSLLGDSSLCYSSNRNRYDFNTGHCLAQKEYVFHIAKLLNTNVRSYIKDKNSYSYGKEFFITSYYNRYELEKIYNLCFVSGKKTVTKEWADKLSPLAIAYWYMDDGSSHKKNNNVNVNFSTLSFTREECEILQNRLLEFNIETRLHKHSDGYGTTISVRQNSVNRFMDLVEPYIIDCFKYKIKRKDLK